MKKLGRRARKRRHLQRTKQVASSYETPPGYFRTKTLLNYDYQNNEKEFVVDFGRDSAPKPGSLRWRKNQEMVEDMLRLERILDD